VLSKLDGLAGDHLSRRISAVDQAHLTIGRLGAFLSRLLGDPDLDNAQEREIKKPGANGGVSSRCGKREGGGGVGEGAVSKSHFLSLS
jgi:hypothetical protein